MINSRMICLECVMDILEQKKHSHLVISNTLDNYQYLEKRDRAFINRVCTGTVERCIELDYIINQFSKVKVTKMKPVIRNILRISVYQLKYMDSVPNTAVCNEAVKLAVKKGFHTLKGFVNGVLRNIDRNFNNITYPAKDTVEYLEIKYSMPSWIIKKWIKDYSKETTIKILEGFLDEDKSITIRCNTNKITVDKLINQLSSDIKDIERSMYCDDGLKIKGYNYLSKIDAFNDGLFYVQDESSMVCADATGAKDNDYIIDVCAAPGGKTVSVALKMNGTGMVDSRDINEYKVGLIEENIERMALSNVKTKEWDALVLDKECIGVADVVIADLPCSGLGVIGKKADIKYNVTSEDLEELCAIQKNMLSVVKDYVKVGGTLIYSTCTINKGENEDNVKWFLENNSDFKLDSLTPYVGNNIVCTQEGMIQMMPGVHNVDGFFIARFKKI
ncbi:MAG: 16S rRNA (cytosine(967)-C(5))-methyltransferase RsmB [Lachnospiraceae bacterium]|nr:16S rRNA (cytosine(967)-C(5))-methyltransferase RsmB [Lachnospiraceae bacterium]